MRDRRMIEFVVDALATFRLSRLVVQDTILDEPRARLLVALERDGHDKLAYLVGCPWCVSPYLAAAVVCARRLAPRAWSPVARTLAFSAVAGIVHTLTSE